MSGVGVIYAAKARLWYLHTYRELKREMDQSSICLKTLNAMPILYSTCERFLAPWSLSIAEPLQLASDSYSLLRGKSNRLIEVHTCRPVWVRALLVQ